MLLFLLLLSTIGIYAADFWSFLTKKRQCLNAGWQFLKKISNLDVKIPFSRILIGKTISTALAQNGTVQVSLFVFSPVRDKTLQLNFFIVIFWCYKKYIHNTLVSLITVRSRINVGGWLFPKINNRRDWNNHRGRSQIPYFNAYRAFTVD